MGDLPGVARVVPAHGNFGSIKGVSAFSIARMTHAVVGMVPGAQIDPATEGTVSSLATAASLTNTLAREIATWTAGVLPVDQQTPVGLERSDGTQIDPATEASLTNTLAREIATRSARTLPVDRQTAVDISDRNGLVLGDVDVTSDPYHHRGSWDSASLASGGTLTISLRSDGAERLQGRLVSDNTYDVEVDWLNGASAVIFTNTIASGVAGGTTTTLNELAIAPDADERILEQASGASLADGIVQIV